MKKNVGTIKPDCQLANEFLYILCWIEILHHNALWILKPINVKLKYFRISRNYTKIILELKYKKNYKNYNCISKSKKCIKYSNDLPNG